MARWLIDQSEASMEYFDQSEDRMRSVDQSEVSRRPIDQSEADVCGLHITRVIPGHRGNWSAVLIVARQENTSRQSTNQKPERDLLTNQRPA